MPGASGRVVAAGLTASGNASRRTQTGADGRFELRHQPAGWFRLRIEAGGFLVFEQDGLQIPASTARTNLGRFSLQRGAALRGQAGDPEGNPIAGAEVWILPAEVRDWADLYARGPAAITGADGSFLVRDLPRGDSFGLDICRAGYLPLSATVREIPEEPFRAVLRRAARLSGRVTAGDGSPVPAARVESWLAGEEPSRSESLRPCRGGTLTGQILGLDREELARASIEVELLPPLQARAAVDPQGNYRIENLPPGEWTLTARAGDRTVRAQAVLPPNASYAAVDLVFEPSHEVSGWTSGPAGEPVADA